ncbi:MAG: hypothetical protein UY07_C0021G0028, partial [Parcubacteria group bacterium GW2011_GWA1_47_8]
MIGTHFVATTLGYRFGAEHHEGAAGGGVCFFVHTEITGRPCFDCALAIRVVGATVKDTEATFAFGHKTFFTDRARDARVVCECGGIVFFYKLAFRVASTGDESSEATIAFDEVCLAALGVELARVARTRELGAVYHPCANAFGIIFTRKKFSGARELDDHRTIALGAFVRRVGSCSMQVLLKSLIQNGLPRAFSCMQKHFPDF